MNSIPIETALGYLEAGLSCLPAAREKKHPVCGAWKKYAVALPKRIEVESWFANKHDAVCIVTGAVSGNLECMDFDNHGELFDKWMEKVDTALLARLVIEQTPSGGYHVLYRSEQPIDGNLKLARGIREGKLVTLIETRGEGGLFLCAPSGGYELQQGEFTHIAVITAAEREALLNAARSLDETPATSTQLAASSPTSALLAPLAANGTAFIERPGDDFASRGDIRPYLMASGWTMIGTHPSGNELWRRPGKASGSHSATFDGKVFYVFSSNAAPFESGKGYSQFQVYTLLEHHGDFTEAARSLMEKGFGKSEDPLLGVDLSHFNPPVGVTAAPASMCASVEDDIPIDRLVEQYPALRPKLIHGFLRLGETMNIIAPPKTGKSWLVTDLALSVATGTPWFGFPCEQGRVLIIDNELHPETSANRIPKVIEARGFDLKSVGKYLSIVNLRGRLKSLEDIANHIEHYKSQGYKLIIIDAFYRAMPKGTDENDNGAIAAVYNLIDRFAQEIGCAFCLIHHTSKGNQSLKSVTDVGAGAGSQSRAADTHVILRRHKEQGVVVMESVVRSFKSVEPICLRWQWPLWERDDSLDPNDLDGKAELKTPRNGCEEALAMRKIVERIPSLIDPEKPEPKTAFVGRLQELYSLSRTRARSLVDEAMDLGYIKCEKSGKNDPGDRTAKFVVLGSARPPQPEAPEETEEDEDEDDD